MQKVIEQPPPPLSKKKGKKSLKILKGLTEPGAEEEQTIRLVSLLLFFWFYLFVCLFCFEFCFCHCFFIGGLFFVVWLVFCTVIWFVFVLYLVLKCCQSHWIVQSAIPLRFSLSFLYYHDVQFNKETCLRRFIVSSQEVCFHRLL
jgi:hypothetical protein